MKALLPGIAGLVLGPVSVLLGLPQKNEGGLVLILGGIFLTGCGLVALAIGMRRLP